MAVNAGWFAGMRAWYDGYKQTYGRQPVAAEWIAAMVYVANVSESIAAEMYRRGVDYIRLFGHTAPESEQQEWLAELAGEKGNVIPPELQPPDLPPGAAVPSAEGIIGWVMANKYLAAGAAIGAWWFLFRRR